MSTLLWPLLLAAFVATIALTAMFVIDRGRSEKPTLRERIRELVDTGGDRYQLLAHELLVEGTQRLEGFDLSQVSLRIHLAERDFEVVSERPDEFKNNLAADLASHLGYDGSCSVELFMSDRPGRGWKTEVVEGNETIQPAGPEEDGAPEEQPVAFLLVGSESMEVVLPKGEKLIVGRATDDRIHQHIPIKNDELLSRQHCLIGSTQKADGTWQVWVTDTDSSRGTFVDGQRIHEQRDLAHNSKISVGGTTILVRLPGVGQPAPIEGGQAPTPKGEPSAATAPYSGTVGAERASRSGHAIPEGVVLGQEARGTIVWTCDDSANPHLGVWGGEKSTRTQAIATILSGFPSTVGHLVVDPGLEPAAMAGLSQRDPVHDPLAHSPTVPYDDHSTSDHVACLLQAAVDATYSPVGDVAKRSVETALRRAVINGGFDELHDRANDEEILNSFGQLPSLGLFGGPASKPVSDLLDERCFLTFGECGDKQTSTAAAALTLGAITSHCGCFSKLAVKHDLRAVVVVLEAHRFRSKTFLVRLLSAANSAGVTVVLSAPYPIALGSAAPSATLCFALSEQAVRQARRNLEPLGGAVALADLSPNEALAKVGPNEAVRVTAAGHDY